MVEHKRDVAVQNIGPEDEASLAAYESILASVRRAYQKAAPSDLQKWLQTTEVDTFIKNKLREKFGDAAPHLEKELRAELLSMDKN